MSRVAPGEKTLILKKLVIYALAVIVSSWILVPLALIFISAFAVPEEYYDLNRIIPTSFTLENVNALLFVLKEWKATLNSIIVALLTIAISFALGLPAGYALARYIFPGKDMFKLLIISLRMFPLMIMAIPLTILYLNLGLSDTLLGVAIAHTSLALPFVVLITSSIFVSVPVEYEEAGMIFGLTRFETFFRITLPLILPGLAAAAIFTFVMSWNEVFVASVLTLVNRTLPADILVSVLAAPDPYKFAAGFIMVLPAMIFVFIARKYLVAMWGITLR
ncbi:MAG: sugar ABC transporter permease [Thermofilum sp. ex4484_82]|nr:MAG: sugar ABC transporter permease [Thermofilum sp. ex4484_82]OYT39107.1 MAG: sugar ABC transporter permease [Archaeoglobales archaeon ex4484_92]RLE84641.1 MAG: carbohydrate ABC transporter permease [Thermoprotei archaeon]